MPSEPLQPLDRRPVIEPRIVYRFVHVEDTQQAPPVDDFECDRLSGKRPDRRERAYPELQDGMSVYGSLEKASEMWQNVAKIAASRGEEPRIGNHIAEVELVPDQGFDLEDLREPDEHMTMWGEKDRLAAAVRRIYPAATNAE